MSQKYIAVITLSALLHLTFIALSYDASLLSSFGYIIDPIVMERMVMFLQFVPLVMIISIRRLFRNKLLLFLGFAICISTIYIVNDFHDGIYAATINYNLGLMPRMRLSAQMMVYKDLGRLNPLDYHAEYFLEFVLVFFISEVTGLNYILVYTFAIRMFLIIAWSVLFVWTTNLLSKSKEHHKLWILLLACSMLLAVEGYNFEVSFAPLLLLMLYLIVVGKSQSRRFSACALMVAAAVLLASFREVLLGAAITALTLSISAIMANIKPSSSPARKPHLILALLVLFFGRIFEFSSLSYVESYISRLTVFVNSIKTALSNNLIPRRELLTTLSSIPNPIDQATAYISVVGAVGILTLLAILSLLYLAREHHRDAFFFSVAIAFILAMAIPLASYATIIFTGFATIRDYSSFTVLARSLAPIVTLTIFTYFIQKKSINSMGKRVTKLLKFLALVLLSFSIMFGPFLFLRGEVKSSYDMVNAKADNNLAFMTGTSIYHFIVGYTAGPEAVSITHNPNNPRSQLMNFFFIYYSLPLEYKLGNDRVEVTETPKGIQLGEIYDNGIYAITSYYTNGFGSLAINQSDYVP